MPDYKNLIECVLKAIVPSPLERRREQEIISEIFNVIENLPQYEKFNLKPVLVGSIAKDTDLRMNKDVDLFIAFPDSVERKILESEGLSIGKSVFEILGSSFEIDYAEHPYVKGIYKNYEIEIVPCYSVASAAKIHSAVDRTPFHTSYVRRALSKDPSLKNEIRILKKFMYAAGVYGAEIKVMGFSGYLVELLVIYYGSFLNTLEAFSRWKFGSVIDIEHHWVKSDKDKQGTQKTVYMFPGDDIIVIDPVDENRNVAAAVSRDALSRFMLRARQFQKCPGAEFFFSEDEMEHKFRAFDEGETTGISEKFRVLKFPEEILRIFKIIRQRGTGVIIVKFVHPAMNENVLYSQLRKTHEIITREIESYNFKILKSDFLSDENNLSVMVIEFEVWELPRAKRVRGPRIDMSSKDQLKFTEKYPGAYLEDGFWFADTERKFKTAQEVVADIIKKKGGFGKGMKSEDCVITAQQVESPGALTEIIRYIENCSYERKEEMRYAFMKFFVKFFIGV